MDESFNRYNNIIEPLMNFQNDLTQTNDVTLNKMFDLQLTLTSLVYQFGIKTGTWVSMFISKKVDWNILPIAKGASSAIVSLNQTFIYNSRGTGLADIYKDQKVQVALSAMRGLLDEAQDYLQNNSSLDVDVGQWYGNATIVMDALLGLSKNISVIISAQIFNTVQPALRANLSLYIIGFCLELIASVQLCWVAFPIVKFYVVTELSLQSDTRVSKQVGSKSKVSKEGKTVPGEVESE